jgi:hypothetical protein
MNRHNEQMDGVNPQFRLKGCLKSSKRPLQVLGLQIRLLKHLLEGAFRVSV